MFGATMVWPCYSYFFFSLLCVLFLSTAFEGSPCPYGLASLHYYYVLHVRVLTSVFQLLHIIIKVCCDGCMST